MILFRKKKRSLNEVKPFYKKFCIIFYINNITYTTKHTINEIEMYMSTVSKMKRSANDAVIRTAKRAINEFASVNDSTDIENITSEYLPFVVDKILELSKNIIVFDGDNSFLGKYADAFKKHNTHIEKITVYSDVLGNEKTSEDQISQDSSFLEKTHFKLIDHETVQELSKSNIKNVLIGDKTRFLLEKPKPLATFATFKQSFLDLFSLKRNTDIYEHPVSYQSTTNFGDSRRAAKIASTLKRATV